MTWIETAQILKSEKAAHWALGAGMALFTILLSLPVLFVFREQGHELAASLHRLSVLRAQGAQVPALKARLGALEQRAESLPGAVQSKTVTLAQSRLQQSIEAIVSGNGGTVRSAQILAPVEENGFNILAIQYDLAVPMSKLKNLTYAIETRLPYLFITDVSITGGQESEPSQPQDPQLEVRWTIRAYRWGSA
jgi:hypothetical protein